MGKHHRHDEDNDDHHRKSSSSPSKNHHRSSSTSKYEQQQRSSSHHHHHHRHKNNHDYRDEYKHHPKTQLEIELESSLSKNSKDDFRSVLKKKSKEVEEKFRSNSVVDPTRTYNNNGNNGIDLNTLIYSLEEKKRVHGSIPRDELIQALLLLPRKLNVEEAVAESPLKKSSGNKLRR